MFTNIENAEGLKPLVEAVEEKLKPIFKKIDENTDHLQARMLRAFQTNKVCDSHFHPSTGYGYNDEGRDTLEQLYATVFGGEAGLVRPQMISGTHAITVALFGVLRPGDELLYITGVPYDTLHSVIGLAEDKRGSLAEYGIHFNCVELTKNGDFDKEGIKQAIHSGTKVVAIQRSKGYATRPSVTIDQIEDIITYVKSIQKEVIIFVDNCYGEFVEDKEPNMVGADLIAGSLIKNPGGGIVKTGGYIVGREELIDQCAFRLIAPGIGREAGATLYALHEMFQGFFLAPHVVSQALKGAIFTSGILEQVGLETYPKWDAKRTDLVQSVTFEKPDQMISFCQAIQWASPINSQFKPVPSYMPGYAHDVIMAAGTFIQGASIELTADGPIRPPYTAFVQGGLTYSHVKIAIVSAIDQLIQQNLIQLKKGSVNG